MMPDSLKQGAIRIVRTLTEKGYAAYLVGGCVRDEQLNRPVKDYDIATSARPEQVQRLFDRTVPTGLQHGTVTILIGRTPYEVTTFRRESVYEGYRRPSEVEYIDDLHEDLQRRDFTMNAMAMDSEGKLIDPFHGLDDIKQGILRCVGQAEERFREDALRMIRCVRFAAEYGLKVEPSTWDGFMACVPLLKHIAMERVRMELERMLEGRDPNLAFKLLEQSNALNYTKKGVLLSRINGVSHWPDLRKLPEEETRLAYIYLQLGAGPSEAAEDMSKLTFSRSQIDAVKRILAAYVMLDSGAESNPLAPSDGKRLWILTALRYGKETLGRIRHILLLQQEHQDFNRHSSNSPIFNEWIISGQTWLEDIPAAELSELAVTGQELLQELKIKGGPWLGQLLNLLLEKVALGELANEKQTLLDAAVSYFEEMRSYEDNE